MFGFLYALYTVTVNGLARYNEFITNLTYKNEAIAQNKTTYLDDKGYMRDVHTDHVLHYVHEKDGLKLYDVNTNRMIENVTVTKKAQDIIKAQKYSVDNNLSTVCIDTDHHSNDRIQGRRYIDKKSGETYVIRSLNGFESYMSINTGKFIRLTDRESERIKDFIDINDDYFKKEFDIYNEDTLPFMRERNTDYIGGNWNSMMTEGE